MLTVWQQFLVRRAQERILFALGGLLSCESCRVVLPLIGAPELLSVQ